MWLPYVCTRYVHSCQPYSCDTAEVLIRSPRARGTPAARRATGNGARDFGRGGKERKWALMPQNFP